MAEIQNSDVDVDPLTPADVDNLAKLWLDCLQESFIILNDKYVHQGNFKKKFAKKKEDVGVNIDIYFNTDVHFKYHTRVIGKSTFTKNYILKDYWNNKLINEGTFGIYCSLFKVVNKYNKFNEIELQDMLKALPKKHLTLFETYLIKKEIVAKLTETKIKRMAKLLLDCK